MAWFDNGRRKQILVDRPFQLKATAVGIAYIAMVAVCLSVPLYHLMKGTGILLEGRGDELNAVYQTQQLYTIVAISVFFVSIVLSWTVFSLWRSHRIAGPVVKITRHIHDLVAGKFDSRCALRVGDEMQALAGAMNDLAISLQERDAATRHNLKSHIAETKRQLYASGSPEQAMSSLDALAREVDETLPELPIVTNEPETEAAEELITT